MRRLEKLLPASEDLRVPCLRFLDDFVRRVQGAGRDGLFAVAKFNEPTGVPDIAFNPQRLALLLDNH